MARRFHLTGQAPPGARAEEKPGAALTPSRKESPVRRGDPLWALEGKRQDLCHGAATWIRNFLQSLHAFSLCHLPANGRHRPQTKQPELELTDHFGSKRFSTLCFHSRVAGTQ